MNQNLRTYLTGLEQSIGAELFFVGGVVRDHILGVPCNDIDLVARGLSQGDLVAALSNHGKVEVTGALFGVTRFFPNDRSMPMLEISLPRQEVSTGSGHDEFEITFDHNLPIEDDLGRRDFVVNSMAMRVSNDVLIDPFGAREDLNEGFLCFISETSASEDPLRILRAIRFVSKLGFSPDATTHNQLVDNVELLANVSAERVQEELLKIVIGEHVDKALHYAQEVGILKVILPELEENVGCIQNHYHAYDVFTHIVKVVKECRSKDHFTLLAALFHDVGKARTRWKGIDGVFHFYNPEPGQEFLEEPQVFGDHETVGASMTRVIMNRLRFSSYNVDRVSQLVRWHMFIHKRDLGRKAARKLLANLSVMPGDIRENVDAMFDLREGDCRGGKPGIEAEKIVEMNRDFHKLLLDEIEKENAFTVKSLAIGGKELIELGIERGPIFSVILNDLLDKVLEDPSLNNRDTLLAMVGGI